MTGGQLTSPEHEGVVAEFTAEADGTLKCVVEDENAAMTILLSRASAWREHREGISILLPEFPEKGCTERKINAIIPHSELIPQNVSNNIFERGSHYATDSRKGLQRREPESGQHHCRPDSAEA